MALSMHRGYTRNASGFTLVELSIVLVILGLLAGGVLSGQALIHAAEIRGIITDADRYTTATQAFRDKYFALPGDMPNATAFWFKNNTSCPLDTGTANTPGTCNGNGNGTLEYPAAAGATGEAFRAWQHLALAGLISGTYSGNAGSVTAADPDLGVNSPASKIQSVGWGYGYYDNSTGANGYSFNNDMRNWLVLGNEADNNFADGPALNTNDTWNIDTKLDDGKPGTGKVMANVIGSCTNATGPTDRAATYLLATEAPNLCGMVFQLF
jgi:prepilin-type N-terminal cleavage/methylation domain-containing protein